ncbi:MAG: hypothetical protein HY960_04195 [Ignavibacteriae bacterium]|nr:hypothetical protein [Ignavibacteriota bacterium]
MKRFYVPLVIILTGLFVASSFSQPFSDPTLRRLGYHTGNRIGVSFYNDGQVAGFNTGLDIRGEWPLGSGENYIGDCIPLVGVEFVDARGETLHSVTISRGPRNNQSNEKHPVYGYFWGWNPRPGYLNPNAQAIAMSHMPNTWPIEGWFDQPDWKDPNGVTQWNGYFGRGITNADQESYFVADDQWDDEFNSYYRPDTANLSRNGMGLKMNVRGFQWSSFLAEDCLFWLYDITNEGTNTYRKSVFGTVVGTLAGGDGDSQDDLGFFDVNDAITYSWDSDGKGNKGQKVGYVAYAFLESPGNPYDGIDNDGDSPDPNSPMFVITDFDSTIYSVGSKVVLIDPTTYVRTIHTVSAAVETVYSLGVQFIIKPGKGFREGHIASIINGVSTPHPSAYDGLDNDLDGVVDENQAIHYETRIRRNQPAVKYKNFRTGAGVSDPLIDEQRDNDKGTMALNWVRYPDGTTAQIMHWSGDEDGDWDAANDDVGSDGVGPLDNDYFGPDLDGTEGNGVPDQGEPNFGKTDPDESDQIGLTSFNFFNISASPDMANDLILWDRMKPGRFDVIPQQPQDGDFIYASGYFPMRPKQVERFSVALLFGADYEDVVRNKKIVQQIYNAGYKFPQPPRKPKINLTEQNGKVVIYWDGRLTENSRDFITKKKDFQGYKIYRATDVGFRDARQITDAKGVLAFDKPIAQFDLKDTISGYFAPSAELLAQVGGTTYWLGSNTGIMNKFVDSTVVPGQRYFYAVVSYDGGDSKLNIFPSENSKFIFQTNTGEILNDDNTGYITPGAPPIGYVEAKPSNLTKADGFRATGNAWVEIVDDKKVIDGKKYQIVFQDSGVQHYTLNWSLVDNTTPDTVLINSTGETKIVSPGDSVTVPVNDTITINGESYFSTASTFTAGYDTLIAHDTTYSGNTLIKDGFKVQMMNDKEIIKDTLKSKFEGALLTDFQQYTFAPFFWAETGRASTYNGRRVPYNYQFEFYNTIVDTSVADTLYPNTSTNRKPAIPITFKVKNLTTGNYIDVVYFTTGSISVIHNIWFKEVINGKKYRTWRVNFNYKSVVPIEQTGTLSIYTLKPFSTYDSYTFTMVGPHIDKPKAATLLDEIKVVPNPYVVMHDLEPRLLSLQQSGRGERFIRFTHVPPGSTISIFTVRGELVRKLTHDYLSVGDVKWNLRTEENLDAAYGVYIFVVEAPEIGTKTGKFALIK